MTRTVPPASPQAVESPVPPPQFTCSWRRGGSDAIWVHVTGALDRETAPRLAQTLQTARMNARMVVLDLRQLTSIDGWGARTVMEAAVRARLDHGRQVVVRGPAQVQRVLARLGVAARLDLVEIGEPG
jgi:anti-anti-sigma factor